MDTLNFIKNLMVSSNYELAKMNGIKQKDFYDVQQDGGQFNVVKNGEVIATFNDHLRANMFKVKCERGV